MAYTWQAEDSIEPISSSTIEAIANIGTYSVATGCTVSYGVGTMICTVAAGNVLFSSVLQTVAGNTVTLVADASNPRWTWIAINSSGVAVMVAGTAAASPSVPELGNNVGIALVKVEAAQTSANAIVYKLDKRVLSPASQAVATATGDIIYASAPFTPARLAIGSSAQVLTVTAGLPVWATPATPTTPLFFDLLQTAFRTPRRLLAMFSAVFVPVMFDGVTYSPATIGVGFTHTNSASSITSTGTLNNALLESYTTQNTGGTATDVYASTTGGSSITMSPSTAPNKNPRMSVRYFPGGTSVQMRSFVGFMASAANASETASGAYLRVNTTGNLFFVTRQGASETTTDLGARPSTLTSYEIETTDSGVTWTCRNVTTAAVVATHTTNVPTAASGLGYVVGGRSASGDLVVNNVNYCEVDSNSVA